MKRPAMPSIRLRFPKIKAVSVLGFFVYLMELAALMCASLAGFVVHPAVGYIAIAASLILVARAMTSIIDDTAERYEEEYHDSRYEGW